MNSLKIWIITVLLLGAFHEGNTQTVNWGALGNTKHLVHVDIGWDYSLAYSVGYMYKTNTTIPIVLNSLASIPSGEKLFDDFKVKAGGQIVLLNKSNLRGSISFSGIYRGYENPLVRLENFGSEIKGTFGFYKSKWFAAGEIGFDKAIVTNFKHSESFRDNVFQGVKDGWYEPATGGNLLYGIQTGCSFEKSDITLNIGKVLTQDFKTTPLISYYLTLGFNYKINQSSE